MATKHKQSDEQQQLSLFDEETDLASNLHEADDDWLQEDLGIDFEPSDRLNLKRMSY